jgi:type II secretory pathway pseudopilin PulG
VELLVVISIIALLISILLPSLSKVREQAQRVNCAANLRTLGQICVLFANDHQGRLPAAWGYGQDNYTTNAACFPPIISYNLDNFTSADPAKARQWQRFGTPYQEFLRYARSTTSSVTVPITGSTPTGLANWLICPSTRNTHIGGWVSQGDGWGWAITTDYLYVAGLPARTLGSFPEYGAIGNVPSTNFGARIPMVKLNDRDAGQRVIAADIVWWAGGANIDQYVINHIDRTNARAVAYQSVLFGDGHVGGEKPGYTDSTGKKSNIPNATNWSITHAANVPPYFYWGQGR